MTIRTKARPASAAMIIVSRSSCFCSGVLSDSVLLSRSAMWPISVPMPVVVTISSPRPRVTEVFMKAMLWRSPSGTSGLSITALSLDEATLSPVSAASSISSVAVTNSRPSAGTTSPASTSTTSPGTTCSRSICCAAPSRRTVVDILHRPGQRRQAGRGFGFAAQAQQRVEDRQDDQHDRRAPLTGEDDVDQRRHQQDDLHEVFVLAQERLQARFLLLIRQLVGTVLLQALLRFGGAQALGGINLQLFGDVFRRQRIPLGLTTFWL